uniref:Uncharacterized protein n=1 Tax=Oryza barthii TaxID=65489 RepID=A0A0D3HPV1_9ORYZ
MQGGRGGSNIVVDGSGYAACGSAAAALDLIGAVDSKDRETRAADGKEAQLGWRGGRAASSWASTSSPLELTVVLETSGGGRIRRGRPGDSAQERGGRGKGVGGGGSSSSLLVGTLFLSGASPLLREEFLGRVEAVAGQRGKLKLPKQCRSASSSTLAEHGKKAS